MALSLRNGYFECEGIERCEGLPQRLTLGFIDGLEGQEALVGSLGLVVAPLVFGSDAFLLQKLDRWAEEVLIGLPLIGVKLVEQIDDGRLFEAVVAQELAHMSPVLLLDVGVVVFLVRATPCELHRFFAVHKIAP